MKIWEIPSGRAFRTLAVPPDKIWSISFSADGKLLAGAGNENVIVWDFDTGRLLRTPEGQHAPITFSPAGKQLSTSGTDGATTLWNIETWERMSSLPYAANALAFSQDGKHLAAAMNEMKVWEVSSGKETMSCQRLIVCSGFRQPRGIGRRNIQELIGKP